MNVMEFILSNEEYQKNLIARYVYHGNAIEGNTISFDDTYDIMYNNDFSRSWGKDAREVDEIVNHKNAIEMVVERVNKGKELSEKFIKKLDATMTHNIRDSIGYRNTITYIEGSTYVPPPPERLPMLMLYLVDNYNKDTQDPFIKASKFHMEFEKAHPFEDGTGRVGRLLINFELIKNNLAPVVIEYEDRNLYFSYIRDFNELEFAEWLRALSEREKEVMKKYGYVED